MRKKAKKKVFHTQQDRKMARQTQRTTNGKKVIDPNLKGQTVTLDRELTYRFYSHFHPYTGEMIQRLQEKSISGLMEIDTEYKGRLDQPFKDEDYKHYEIIFNTSKYGPTKMVDTHYPVKDLDFSSRGAYSIYNWELFYHVPLTIAIHLSKNQRFEEAQKWFHYIFDPTDDSQGPTPERFWKLKPFQTSDVTAIETMLLNLAGKTDPELHDETMSSIAAWEHEPFRPHSLARHRPTAYMMKTVMAYLDNLIAWGDSLFRQDSGESINEATQIYIMAANILGPKPQPTPIKGKMRPQTYANLKADLDKFGNALQNLESEIPFDLSPLPADNSSPNQDKVAALQGITQSLYFCIPPNEKLLAYWDTIADRLFKIHNSLNIEGTFRQLPLFDPPIDPGLLASAAAAGLNVGAMVTGANQPLPLVRFQVLIQKASEIVQEVKSLGNLLLSTVEKEDNEALAILRAKHEHMVLQLAESVKYQQLQEAIKSREALEVSMANAIHRYTHYERMLGKNENEVKVPDLEGLDLERLRDFKFSSNEPTLSKRSIKVDIDQDSESDEGGQIMSSFEAQELSHLNAAQWIQDSAAIVETIGSILNLVPMNSVDAKPLGVGAGLTIGGYNFAQMLLMTANAGRAVAARFNFAANQAAKIGSYERREQEWALQSNLVVGEINQLYKQLRGAQIRESIASVEWKNHQQQIKNAQEIEIFLTDEKNGKTANQALYSWMRREVRALYAQCFQFAFDVARKAERALQAELGDPKLSFIQFGYTTGKQGLLAGEKLHFDLKRMEMAYLDLNRREYELTKHVSLMQLNPLSLLQLKTQGRCTISLPEDLFDMDCPGHYFRRIKSVSLSLPCVTGPYTSVNCSLTLTKSSVRKDATLLNGSYGREGSEDSRFSDYFGTNQTIVTSSGQTDSGSFEPNPRDERYQPFEGAGAISEWQLELPAGVPQFDYATIADAILHVRYTAREGGFLLRSQAIKDLDDRIAESQAAGSIRLVSVRQEFCSAWSKFKSVQISGVTKSAELTLNLKEALYPYWAKGKVQSLRQVMFFAKTQKNSVALRETTDAAAPRDLLRKDPMLPGMATGSLENIALPQPVSTMTVHFEDNSIDDLWIVLTWGTGT